MNDIYEIHHLYLVMKELTIKAIWFLDLLQIREPQDNYGYEHRAGG